MIFVAEYRYSHKSRKSRGFWSSGSWQLRSSLVCWPYMNTPGSSLCSSLLLNSLTSSNEWTLLLKLWDDLAIWGSQSLCMTLDVTENSTGRMFHILYLTNNVASYTQLLLCHLQPTGDDWWRISCSRNIMDGMFTAQNLGVPFWDLVRLSIHLSLSWMCLNRDLSSFWLVS